MGKEMNVEKVAKVILGADLGNGYSKFVASCGDKKIDFVMPSGFLYKHRVETESYLNNTSDDEYYIKTENNASPTVYIWNEDVNKHIDFESLIGGGGRYNRIEYQVFFSMLLSKVVEDLGIVDENIEFYMTSGIPSQEKGSQLEDDLRNAIFSLPTIVRKGKEFKPNVKELFILPQPLGTVFNELLDADGIAKDEEEFDEHLIALLDIGTGTVDFDVLKNREAVKNQRKTREVGMSDVYSGVVEYIFEKEGLAVPFSNVELQFNNSDYRISKRKYVNIVEAKEKAVKEVFDEITITMNGIWKNPAFFDKIILTGGGASMFYPLFKEEGYDVVLAENNQFANALGFYKLAILKYS